jgi:hypothetical protein
MSWFCSSALAFAAIAASKAEKYEVPACILQYLFYENFDLTAPANLHKAPWALESNQING